MWLSSSWRSVVSAASSGSGTFSSVRKWPNSDSSSSPTGFSSETGGCALPMIWSTSLTGRARAARDLLHLVERQVEISSDLERQRLTAELGPELPLRPDDLVQLLDDVDG